jgi:hypothetical protein
MNKEKIKYRVAIKQSDGSYKRCEVASMLWRCDYLIVEYSYQKDVNHGIIGKVKVDNKSVILERGVGIVDKHGNDIFEGDCVRYFNESDNTLHYGVVEWCDGKGTTSGQWLACGYEIDLDNPNSKYYPQKSQWIFSPSWEIVGTTFSKYEE